MRKNLVPITIAVAIICVIVVCIIVGFILKFTGVIGDTVIERVAFENSFQYSEGQKQKIAIYEAQLAEIETRLSSSLIEEGVKKDLEAQRSAIRVQLAAAKRIEK